MTQEESHQKKHFTIPNKDELIQQIKNLDQQIQHISLNLIKCDFNATQKDVEKAFPEFKFIKVKNYNPGSFQIVLEMRIDAINFIKTCYDRKILNRRFFIKMGRQHKQLIQDWTGVGYAPRQFRHPNKNHNKDHQNKDNQNKDYPKEDRQHKEHKQHKDHKEHKEYKKHNQHKKQEQKKQKVEEQAKQQKPKVQEPAKQQKQKPQQVSQVKKGKEIPKTDYHKKKTNNYHKGDNTHNNEKKSEHIQQVTHQKPVQKVQKPAQKVQKIEKVQKVQKTQKVQKVQQKKVEKVQKVQQKKVEKGATNNKPLQVAKTAQKQKVVQKPKVVQKQKVQQKQEDDGWITVPQKTNNKNKKR